MNDQALEPSDDHILSFEISDEALEAAASQAPAGAMSLPAAPTVNILVMCCGNNIAAPDRE